jgi:NAD(P)H dehydrogenase (quinone)
MHVLLVFCHPAPESFQRSILHGLTDRLRADGHRLRIVDLYAEGFDPVLENEAWAAHRANEGHAEGLGEHLQALREAEGLVLVYPTWWYGLPAMLKGWIDRVWQPELAFTIENGAFRTHRLTQIRRFGVITTCGSPRGFIELVVGDPARRQLMRGLALQLAKGCKTCWRPIYSVDVRSRDDLGRERGRAVDALARLFAAL